MMRLRAAVLWLAAAALVAYLSFVPFYFQPLALEEALRRFSHIPYLNLGAGNRADWVANILMFVPLGGLAAAVFAPAPRGGRALWAVVPATLAGAAWAVAVEFAQLYFPNRTVSLNDIVAEVIGALLGASLWCVFGARSVDWWRRLLRGGQATANAALAAYLVAYLVMSLSPFDFVVAIDEIAEKAASNLHGLWLAPIGCGQTPCSVKLAAESLAVLPLGWWLAMRGSGGRGAVIAAAVFGAGLGLAIEAAQFLLVSGTSQGASVVARALGVAAGAWLHGARHRIVDIDWARWGRPLVLASALPWLAAVAYVAGWLGGRWLSVEGALARLPDVQWMPFYYQYYSTEQALIRSTLVHLFLYAPVGLAVWLWGRRQKRASAAIAAAIAAAVALVAETGKLFVAGKHPDYTDVLIAMSAAWAVATVLRWTSDKPFDAAERLGHRRRRAQAADRGTVAAAAPLAVTPGAGRAIDTLPRQPAAPAHAPAAVPPLSNGASATGDRDLLPWEATEPLELALASSAASWCSAGGRAGALPAPRQLAGRAPTDGGVQPLSRGAHDVSIAAATTPALARSLPARAIGVVVLLLVAVSVMRFPLWQLPLALGLAAYGAVLARLPLAYLIVVPVALPLLDLAPYSGRFFWDEFDLLLATTLGVRLLLAHGPAGVGPRLPVLPLALLGLSVAVSAAIALWPPAPLDGNAFTNYLSPYNALRVGKGYLWAACLLWLLWRDAAAGRNVSARLQVGLGLALLAAVFGVFWERLLFVGLSNFDAWFRAAGLVSALHVGGAYLEALLVALTPFSLALALAARRPVFGLFWLGVTALAAVALLLTLSRAGAAAWAVTLLAFALLWWAGRRRAGASVDALSGRGWAGVLALAVLAGAGSLFAQSDALRYRLAAADKDLGVRLAHWHAALALREGSLAHQLFGTGLGSFPREFYLAHAASAQLPAYRLERDATDGQPILALTGGRGMFVDQRISAPAGRPLRLRGEIRGASNGAGLAVALCEKSFLASTTCDWVEIPASDGWARFEALLRRPAASVSRLGFEAPVSLSLHNGRFGTRVEVRGLSLADGDTELLANGAFTAGLDRWLMHSDVHLAWRVLNSPLQVLVEQGIFGLLAWAALAVAVLARALREARRVAPAAAAAALGLMLVGAFDTLLDSPRLVVAAAFILWLVLRPADGAASASNRGRALAGVRPDG